MIGPESNQVERPWQIRAEQNRIVRQFEETVFPFAVQGDYALLSTSSMISFDACRWDRKRCPPESAPPPPNHKRWDLRDFENNVQNGSGVDGAAVAPSRSEANLAGCLNSSFI
jgi:hypothetical protein